MFHTIIRAIRLGSRRLAHAIAAFIPEPITVETFNAPAPEHSALFGRAGSGSWDDPEAFDFRHGIFSF